jgi:hypothetical protein
MADKKKEETAVVTGSGAANNPHLQSVLSSIEAGYKPNRIGKSNRQIRIDHTAMFPNDRDVYGMKTVVQNGAEVQVPVLLFRKGWYLSVEEKHMRDTLLEKGTDTLKMNKQVWQAMEDAGMEVVKKPAEISDSKVVS